MTCYDVITYVKRVPDAGEESLALLKDVEDDAVKLEQHAHHEEQLRQKDTRSYTA